MLESEVVAVAGMPKVSRKSYCMMTVAAGGQLTTQVFVPCDVVPFGGPCGPSVVVRCRSRAFVAQEDFDPEDVSKYQLPALVSTVGEWVKVDVEQLIAEACGLMVAIVKVFRCHYKLEGDDETMRILRQELITTVGKGHKPKPAPKPPHAESSSEDDFSGAASRVMRQHQRTTTHVSANAEAAWLEDLGFEEGDGVPQPLDPLGTSLRSMDEALGSLLELDKGSLAGVYGPDAPDPDAPDPELALDEEELEASDGSSSSSDSDLDKLTDVSNETAIREAYKLDTPKHIPRMKRWDISRDGVIIGTIHEIGASYKAICRLKGHGWRDGAGKKKPCSVFSTARGLRNKHLWLDMLAWLGQGHCQASGPDHHHSTAECLTDKYRMRPRKSA